MNTSLSTATSNRTEILQFVRWLHPDAGAVMELRAFNGRDILSGYFDSPDRLADAAMALPVTCAAVYITLNRIDPELIARRANRIVICGKGGKDETTADSNVIWRTNLLIDIDPRRASGISSTDEKHAAAIAKAHVIADALTGRGWGRYLIADSGNGAHVMFKIDRPRDDGGTVERALKALAKEFDDDAVQVDTGVFNPARITKLFGTVARKGDNLPKYPHRLSRIVKIGGPSDDA